MCRPDRDEAPGEAEREVPAVRERPVRPAPEGFEADILSGFRELSLKCARRPAFGVGAGEARVETGEERGEVTSGHAARMMARAGATACLSPIRYNRGMTETDEQTLLAVAREAARAAAAVLSERFGERAYGVHAKSTPTDLVSDADLAAETAIRAVLDERRPGDGIIAEEGGQTDGGAVRWIVDPLDGTINFLFGIPAFAVSIACEDADGTIAGVVLDPIREECFSATRSGPARLNGSRIEASERDDLALSLVATGFSYDAGLRARQAAVAVRVLPRVRDIRRVGAAALDLAWCGCGRLDGYYERGVKPWDWAAGALIAERAGLVVRELPATGEDPHGLVVAPPAVVDELFELVAS